MRIQHNISALNTYRQMSVNNTGTSKALEKLSSGFKINRAGDDAAGLAISEKMRAQIGGLNRASANSQDGISLIQAAEGALQETHSILQRMRELAVQAANDVNEAEDRNAIQDEINQLTKEVDRIALTTEFNKKTVLDGSQSAGKFIRLTSGFNVSSISHIMPTDATTAPLKNGMTTVAVTTAGEKYNRTFDFSLTTDAAAMTAGVVSNGSVQANGSGAITVTLTDDMVIAAGLDSTDDANKTLVVAVNVGDTGAMVANNLREALEKKLGADFNVTAAGSKLTVEHKFVGDYTGGLTFTFANGAGGAEDTFTYQQDSYDDKGNAGKDVTFMVDGAAPENLQFTGLYTASTGGTLRGRDSIALMILGDGEGTDMNQQFSFRIDDATKLSGAVITTADGSDLTLQVGANTGYTQTIKLAITSLSATSLGVGSLSVLNHGNSQNAIASVDNAITIVSTQRATLGAVQNRLEHTIANLDTVAENLQNAESRIRDVDMAKEMMNFTKFNILMQASQAMMAQANSQPQGVLQLLR